MLSDNFEVVCIKNGSVYRDLIDKSDVKVLRNKVILPKEYYFKHYYERQSGNDWDNLPWYDENEINNNGIIQYIYGYWEVIKNYLF